MSSILEQLYQLGEELQLTLQRNDLVLANEQMDCYLAGLATEFHDAAPQTALNEQQQRLLQQHQIIRSWIENEKNQVESELSHFSKLVRVSDFYKKNSR